MREKYTKLRRWMLRQLFTFMLAFYRITVQLCKPAYSTYCITTRTNKSFTY